MSKVAKEQDIHKKLGPNKAIIKHKKTGKELEVDAIHALTVLARQGNYDILEHTADLGELTAYCDTYEIQYPGSATVKQLIALAKRRG